MIEVTIKLKSAVSPDRDRLLGIATIVNTGTTGRTGKPNYRVVLGKWAPKEREAWKQGIIEGDFNPKDFEITKNSVEDFDNILRGSWDLLFLCLKKLIGSRNGEK